MRLIAAIALILILSQSSSHINCGINPGLGRPAIANQRELACTFTHQPHAPPVSFPLIHTFLITGVGKIEGSIPVYLDGIPLTATLKSSQEGQQITFTQPFTNEATHDLKISITVQQEASKIGVSWLLSSPSSSEMEFVGLSTLDNDYEASIIVNNDEGTIALKGNFPTLLPEGSYFSIALPSFLSFASQDEQDALKEKGWEIFSSQINLIGQSFPNIQGPSINNGFLSFKVKMGKISNPLGYGYLVLALSQGKGQQKNDQRKLEDEELLENIVRSNGCPTGYFMNSSCVKCPVNCIDCNWINWCTSCEEGSTLLNGVCINEMACNDGQFGTSSGCVSCPSQCTKCLGPYSCTECDDTHTLRYGACLISCLAGQYGSNSSEECLNCPSECTECWGPYECISCSEGYSLAWGSRCFYTCPAGQYDDYNSAGNNCVACSLHCISCWDLSYCMECEENYTQVNGNCKIACLAGQYATVDEDGEYCAFCNNSCTNCYNESYCYECPENHFVYNGVCTLICPDGQYGVNDFDDESCANCPTQCTKCYGPFDCIECDENHHLYSGRCILNCPDGQFDSTDTDEEICLNCSSNCNYCEDLSNCRMCQENYTLRYGKCLLNCPDGKYDSYYDSDNSCLSCPSTCTKCREYGECIECVADHILQFGQCNIVCPSGQYGVKDALGDFCSPCPWQCTECVSSYQCTSCQTNHSLNNYNKCIINCPSGELGSIYNNEDICLKIPIHCIGVNANDNYIYCYECGLNYILYSQQKCIRNCSIGMFDDPTTEEETCLQCPSHCSACLGMNECTVCDEGHVLYNKRCLLQCADGKYGEIIDQEEICLDCPKTCTKCRSTFECYECKDDHSLIMGKCGAACDNGFFDDPYTDEEICISCPEHCSQCNPFYCQNCEKGYYQNNMGCVKFCSEGEFEFNGTCIPCPENCMYCKSKEECRGCAKGMTLFNGKCVQNFIECENGKYFDGNNCAECVANCLKCEGPINCSTCARGFYSKEGDCVDSCPKKYYEYSDDKSKYCFPCPENCKECSSKEKCTKCSNSDMDLVDGMCSCKVDVCKKNCPISSKGCSICDGNYFYNTVRETCNICQIESESSENVTAASMSSSYVYQLCTGIFGMRSDQFTIIGKGISGIDLNQNNLCSVGDSKGVIPPGLYNVSELRCSIKKKSSFRVAVLNPITKFSNDSMYDGLFSSLYIYPSENSSHSDFINGQNGIAIPAEYMTYFRVGDRIEITTEGCNAFVKGCAKYPPPSIGKVIITYTENKNEFRINFINWGGVESMDLTNYVYSAAIFSNNLYTELCTDINETDSALGILCNKQNEKRLGFFNFSGNYTIRTRVKYTNGGASDGAWATYNTYITIQDIVASNSSQEVISTPINATNITDLLNDLNFRSQALNNLVLPTKRPLVAATCPEGYCENNGICSISQNRTRCKCPNDFTGMTCQVSIKLRKLAVKQNDEAAQKLLEFASTTDATTIINVVNSITSNTDMVPLSAINNILKSITIAMNSGTNIDYTALNTARTNIMSAMVKNIVVSKSSTRRSLEDVNSTEPTDSETIKQLLSLNDILLGYITQNAAIISGSDNYTLEDIDGQMNMYYFPSTVGSVDVDGVKVEVSTESIISTMNYPSEIAQIFPIPSGSYIGSTIVSVTTQPIVGGGAINTKKTATFLKNTISRRLSISVPQCGFYDDATMQFSTVGCTTSEVDGNVVCTCDTLYSNMYMVYTDEAADDKHSMSKTMLIIVIVVPTGVLLIIALSIGIVCGMRKKGANSINKEIVKLNASSLSMTPTIEIIK